MLTFLHKLNQRGPTGRWVRRVAWTVFIGGLFAGTAAQAQSALSGTYNVCSSCTYTEPQQVVDSMEANGISGPVTVKIDAGDFNSIVIDASISGSSSTNTITFKGAGSSGSGVTRILSAGDTCIYVGKGMSYIEFDDLKMENTGYGSWPNYAYTSVTYGASYITFNNCAFWAQTGDYDTYGVFDQYSDHVKYNKCYMHGGYEAYYGSSTTACVLSKSTIVNGYDYNYYDEYGTQDTISQCTIDSAEDTYNYGCNSIYSYSSDGSVFSGNYIASGTFTMEIDYPNGNDNTNPYMIVNNMIFGNNSPNYDMLYFPSVPSNMNLLVAHNSFYGMQSNSTSIEFSNYGGEGGFTFANNNFVGNSNLSDPLIYFHGAVSSSNGDVVEGNNYYTAGTGNIAYMNGSYISTFSAYEAQLKALGLGQYEQNLATSYVSSTDLHYSSSSPLPYGKGVGITVDYDGDTRCSLFPTSGADEGKPSWSKPTSSFTGPKGKIVEGAPVTFKNGGSATAAQAYKWYIDGKMVSESFDLSTSALKYPTAKVALVTTSCGGSDSLVKTFSIDTPTKAPVTDFIANNNVVRVGDVVKFNDISLNYPSSWTWSISPKLNANGGSPVSTFQYVTGDTFSANMSMTFGFPGKYRICLSTANRVGAGNTECKADYITVLGSYNLASGTSPTPITDTKGYLYDDGGPKNNYSGGYGSAHSALIAPPCAKTVYLVFNYFDLQCGYDYLRIWDGKDNTSKSTEITTCTSNTQYGYGPGLTGGPTMSCYNASITCIPKTTDTFVATSGKMFVQQTTNYYTGAKGFEAYFWSDTKVSTPPVASFDADTNACTNANIDFSSTSTGNDLTYQWFADEDYSYPIDDRANTNYAFLFPGDYKISLVVSNCVGTDTIIKTIHVANPPKPTVAFHADNVNPTTNDVVYLFSDTKECVDAYTWTIAKKYGSAKVTFLNGTTDASAMPQIMLSDTGCYNVTLEVDNATGSSTVTKSCYIYVKNPYCIPVVDNAISDLGISEVKLNTIDNKSDQSGGYENYTPTVSTNLELGVSYPITISRNTGANNAVRTIYIDWNADGDFTDVGETVATEASSRALSWTDTITVPAYAKQGATVMRIAITQGSQTNDPCENGYGEYEDYRLYITSDRTKPVITLNGADTIRVEQGYSFTDPGATAYDNLSGNITKKIVITSSEITTGSSFDILTPGTYIFSYNVKDDANNSADTRKRVVIVTPDMTKPDLEVNSSDTVIVGVFTSFTPPTYTANDLVDGNLTGDVKTKINVDVNKVGVDTNYYSVTDANGNTASKKIIVYVVDTTAPVVMLTGANTIYVNVNTAYTDAGISYTDNYYDSAALAKGLVMNGVVDITKLGTYTVSYTVTDPSGNKSITVNRTVIVQDTMAPMVTLNGGNNVTLAVNNMFMDEGLSITDNYYQQFTVDTEGTFYTKFPNGDATKLGTYTVIYKVTDGSNNVTTVTRNINVVDTTAPVIGLKGEPVVNICRWAPLKDAGFNVSDNYYTGTGITVTSEGSFLKDSTQLPGLFYMRYKAVDSSGNVSYSAWRIINVVECESGIQNVSDLDKSISIYPNPSEGLFTISANGAQQQEVKITVTNMLGQQIAVLNNQVLGNNQIQIDLRGQSAGVYLLNIYSNNQMVTKRITITK